MGTIKAALQAEDQQFISLHELLESLQQVEDGCTLKEAAKYLLREIIRAKEDAPEFFGVPDARGTWWVVEDEPLRCLGYAADHGEYKQQKDLQEPSSDYFAYGFDRTAIEGFLKKRGVSIDLFFDIEERSVLNENATTLRKIGGRPSGRAGQTDRGGVDGAQKQAGRNHGRSDEPSGVGELGGRGASAAGEPHRGLHLGDKRGIEQGAAHSEAHGAAARQKEQLKEHAEQKNALLEKTEQIGKLQAENDRLTAEIEQLKNKPVGTRQLNNLLTVIAAACEHGKLNLETTAKTAGVIRQTMSGMGVDVGETTIEGYLKKIPKALEDKATK